MCGQGAHIMYVILESMMSGPGWQKSSTGLLS